MKKLISAAAAATLLALSLAGCSGGEVGGTSEPAGGASSGEETLSGTLVMTGSTSMTDVCTALNAAFQKEYPDVTVTLNGGGSGAAATALDQGTAQIGNLSRAMKDSENPDGKYTTIEMALDGIAVIVNTENAVEDLTLEQLKQIFTGEITNWKDVGGADAAITCIGREDGSGTRDGFESIVDVEGECKYAVTLDSTGGVKSRVQSDPNAIGYVSFSSVDDSIKDLKVGGVAISAETISDQSYTLQRPFVQAYLKDTDNKLVQAYIEFLQTDTAQEIIEGESLIPVEFWK